MTDHTLSQQAILMINFLFIFDYLIVSNPFEALWAF